MSKKIDISQIVKDHLSTLSDRQGNRSTFDSFVFYYLPVLLSIIFALFNPPVSTAVLGLLVNIGAILTALLFAVLMQVYNQDRSLSDKIEAGATPATNSIKNTQEVLSQLYSNISYAIVCCLALVVSCLLASMMDDKKVSFSFSLWKLDISGSNIFWNSFFLTPLIIFLFINLILTMMMVLKRMHALLVN